MRELKPITETGEPGTIVLAAVDSGVQGEERFSLPVTDELRGLIAAAGVRDSGPRHSALRSADSLDDDDEVLDVEVVHDDDADDASASHADGEVARGLAAAGEPAGTTESTGSTENTAPVAAAEPAEPEEPAEPKMVLRPREIQDRVRGGATVEELLELTGMPVRRIEAFAHPVLAERARIAELGKTSRPRRADGPAKLSLWEILATAFAARGLDLTTSTWDAWRDPAGQWIIGVTWEAGHSTTTAEWAFHAEGAGASTVARNTIAAELVDPDFARPRRNLSSVDPRPAAEPGLRAAPSPVPTDEDEPHSPESIHEDDDLTDEDFLRHPDDEPAPKRRRKTVMPSWEDVLLGVRPTDRK